jgi:hypothetical protein
MPAFEHFEPALTTGNAEGELTKKQTVTKIKTVLFAFTIEVYMDTRF